MSRNRYAGTLLGEKLRLARAETGLTQGELADKSGVALSVIKCIENSHKYNPSHFTVISLCVGLRVASTYFDECFHDDLRESLALAADKRSRRQRK